MNSPREVVGAGPQQALPAKRIPGATYRLQFNSRFTFAQATAVLDYLRDLGITDCYASPIFKAAIQSAHGYDICAFDECDPKLGNLEDFERFTNASRQAGLGLILDMVPNHMGTDWSNSWWMDVLERGRGSRFASYFDIEWEPWNSVVSGKILLPVLEDHYDKVLESGKLRLCFERGGFLLVYHDRRFPLALHSYRTILKQMAATLSEDQSGASTLRDIKSIGDPNSFSDWSSSHWRGSCKIKDQLSYWSETSDMLRTALARTLQEINGVPGSASSFDQLHALIQAQHYRLAYWKVGPEEINYRRFFDVAELVALRVELREVFRSSHEFVASFLRNGTVTGIRIDHPDGLWNPQAYFRQLQEILSTASTDEHPDCSPTSVTRIFTIAEKILTDDEHLPRDWAVDGTTGYDFLNHLNGIFVNLENAEAFDQIYENFIGHRIDYRAVVSSSKQLILEHSFPGDLNALTRRLGQLAAKTRYGQDYTFQEMRRALGEMIIAFPIYRTYVTESSSQVSLPERKFVEQTGENAKARLPQQAALIDFIKCLLLLNPPGDLHINVHRELREFVMKFQQLTSPVMAKGLEDTAFYRYHRLISLNEVGGNPGEFGCRTDQLHRHNEIKREYWPHALLATSTHDTKRGEDVRARIHVLSEMPREWSQAVNRWKGLNADKKTLVNGLSVPDANDEYFLYQTLVGAWPFARPAGGARGNPVHDGTTFSEFRSRIEAYVLKAIRESKMHTSWTHPNDAYENGTRTFVKRLLDPNIGNPFLEDFRQFQERVGFFGVFNSLSQVVIKMAAPGVPDFYQGTELWDLNLVDPDNRRPIDYDLRRHLLNEVMRRASLTSDGLTEFLSQLLTETASGKIKLFVVHRTLAFRQQHRELFQAGAYAPLSAFGPKQNHLFAFTRTHELKSILVIVPRLPFSLVDGCHQPPIGESVWHDTYLAVPNVGSESYYRNLFTNELLNPQKETNGAHHLRLAEVFRKFPVAILETISGSCPR